MKKLIEIFFLFEFICFTACFNDNAHKPMLTTETKNANDTIRRRITQFEEHFNSKLSENWMIQRYSFPENGCEMLDSQVLVKNSVLTLVIELNKKNKAKPYKGGEISLALPFLYGHFKVRMKNEIAPGTVSSFFIMNKWQPENWEHKEIDIEFLGKNKSAVQFNVHHFKNGGKNHVENLHLHQLGFDSSKDFHEYSIEWTKDSISWYVDGKWAYSEKRILIDEEMYIRLNHWAGALDNNFITNWLGKVDTSKLPSRVYYDYIKYEPLK